LSGFASDNDVIELIKTMWHMMKSEDLDFWLSPRLMRRLKTFASEQQEEDSQRTGEVDDELFLAWLLQGGSMESSFKWEVESLSDNGGIYRIILKGGQNEKSAHHNSSE
jgi:uncharacterized protein YihD (DUF1040 family)